MQYDISKFCERLKELIEEKEITPEILAQAIGYSQVYSWLSGQYMPSFNYLIKLADYFQCSIEFLIGLDEENRLTVFNQRQPFAERLPYVIKNCNSNIHRLSKTSKIDRRTIYDWIEGQYLPTLENLVKIASALNCSIDYLIGRDEKK